MKYESLMIYVSAADEFSSEEFMLSSADGNPLPSIDGFLNNYRETGPAISQNGAMVWARAGRLHRLGGPAFITMPGVEGWYLNGRLHRKDGPAYEDRILKIRGWFITGVAIGSCENLIKATNPKRELETFLRMKYIGPKGQ